MLSTGGSHLLSWYDIPRPQQVAAGGEIEWAATMLVASMPSLDITHQASLPVVLVGCRSEDGYASIHLLTPSTGIFTAMLDDTSATMLS